MNKVRSEENALLIWNPQNARTTYINGAELEALADWANGKQNGFSNRLETLGIICENDKKYILEAIKNARFLKAPKNSFCAPESIHIELTARCRLNCPQCYKSLSQQDLLWDFLKNIINQADKMSIFQIALGGGEPLLYPHLLEAINDITSRGMACSVTTSGYALDDDYLKELINTGLNHIQVSLNGSTEKIHSFSRDGFKYAINALSLLQKSSISYGINWVARMDNIDDFPALIDLAKHYKSQNINILRYKPSGRENFSKITLTKEKLLLLEDIIRTTTNISLKVDSAFSNLLCHINNRTGIFSGCGAGRRFFAIDAEGYLRPCSHVDMKEKTSNLNETWFHSENFNMFRVIESYIGEPCKNCIFISGCGSCRAVTHNNTHDFYAGDLNCCFYNKVSE